MKSEFITTRGIDNEVHYWMQYPDEVLNRLYQTYIMSKRSSISGICYYKLGVL